MIGENHALTPGWVQRHVPPSSRLDVRIAVLDIAQDFLLAHLHAHGVFDDLVVFKGGTALRKLFAGAAGRFSTDIDLAARTPNVDRSAASEMIAAAAAVTLGPFTYTPSLSRGRWQIAVTSPLGTPDQSIKLDVGPPCWLAPEVRPSTASRRRPSRPCGSRRSLPRRSRGSRGRFDPHTWLARRDVWDDQQIGVLTHPAPPIRTLEAELCRYYQWLREVKLRHHRLML